MQENIVDGFQVLTEVVMKITLLMSQKIILMYTYDMNFNRLNKTVSV
jgi:hypothetical protein